MSRLDYSKILFGDGMRRAVYSESVGVTSNLGQSSQTQMRYGTVTQDSWTDESSGQRYVEVLLDGSEDAVTLPCDSMFKIGDRVSVLITGTNVKVMAIPDNISEDAAQKAQDAVKEQIKTDVEESLKPLEDSFNQFKEEQQLTNEQVSSQISDAVSTSDAAFESATSATQTVNSFITAVNQKFEDYDEGVIELQTSIKQNADSIAAEVTNRTEAVDGAKSYASSLVSQSATEIRTEFNSKYETIDGEIADFNSYIRESAYGIDVGKTNNNLLARVGSDATFSIVKSGTTVFSISYSGSKTTINGNTNKALELSAGTSTSSNAPKLLLQSGAELDGGAGSITLSSTSGAVYKDTASDSFLQTSGDSAVVGAKLLFSGSTSSSVSLNMSSSNFAMMTIVYSDGSRQMSQTVYSPSGKSVALFRSVNSGSTTYLQSEIVTISGSTISRGLCGQVDIKNGSYPSVDDTVRFTIKYVIGWTG